VQHQHSARKREFPCNSPRQGTYHELPAPAGNGIVACRTSMRERTCDLNGDDTPARVELAVRVLLEAEDQRTQYRVRSTVQGCPRFSPDSWDFRRRQRDGSLHAVETGDRHRGGNVSPNARSICAAEPVPLLPRTSRFSANLPPPRARTEGLRSPAPTPARSPPCRRPSSCTAPRGLQGPLCRPCTAIASPSESPSPRLPTFA
jgi:hypothetical protein